MIFQNIFFFGGGEKFTSQLQQKGHCEYDKESPSEGERGVKNTDANEFHVCYRDIDHIFV